jgi:hypothetical protein
MKSLLAQQLHKKQLTAQIQQLQEQQLRHQQEMQTAVAAAAAAHAASHQKVQEVRTAQVLYGRQGCGSGLI